MNRIAIAGFSGWLLIALAIVVILGLGAIGGYGLASKPSVSQLARTEADSPGTGTVWYTCGMHPQVFQREPGNCPICGMKLTPMKSGEERGTTSASGPQERKIFYWRAPMDPSYVSDHPGKSPMGMDLVPVYADANESLGGTVLRIDPVTIQNMGIRTARVRRGPLVKTIRTVGRVDYDEQTVVFVDTKIMGWIEKLYVNETGQAVRVGDPLFDLYSPDLWQAQIELISAVRKLPTLERSTFPDAAEDARRMVEATRMKLEYFDVSADQIERLQKTMTPVKTLQIRSPADGIVTEKMAVEGMRVMPGMRLFTIADLSRVWVYVDVYEYQLPWVHVGQPATMTLPYIPTKAFRGKVTYIYPYLQKQTRVVKVRLEFGNPTMELKPDMYANVTLEGTIKSDALLIPRDGFIDSGVRKVAFVVRGGGKFEPRNIQIGVEGEGGTVEVLFGLDEGDPVVTSGQFLLDSESKLKEAIAKMMEPVRATGETPTTGVLRMAHLAPEARAVSQPSDDETGHAARPASSRPAPVLADAAYACPMEQHADEKAPSDRGPYFSNVAGKCPRCGMTLKPISELPWALALKSGRDQEVAYTCPTHQQVFSISPGVCPRCGAELEAFKVLYTCPNPQHAEQTGRAHGTCSVCREPFLAYRGPWLSPAMVRKNEPPTTGPALASTSRPTIPETPAQAAGVGRYVCPMHPDRVASDQPGYCPICSMQLVSRENVIGLESGGLSIDAQIDFLMEHYLGIQGQLAADRTDQLASHALGLVDASETLLRLLAPQQNDQTRKLIAAATALHDAAIKIKGRELTQARAQLSELTGAMRTVVALHRPDSKRWPTLYIFHCPMAQADWIQATDTTANPYYGFKMLDCGKIVESK